MMGIAGVVMVERVRRVVRGPAMPAESVVEALAARYARLFAVLEDWAAWCERSRVWLGYPSRSAGFVSGGIHGTFTDSLEGVELSRFEGVTAAIEDLKPIQQAAIYKRYGLATVFRFPRANYEEVLEQAHAELMISLPHKNVYIS